MRVLLAEDDLTLGRAVCAFLMRDGHAVDWATTGNQVLELTGQYPYDCVVLDLGLPELSGGDCLFNLRSRADPTPVIVITAQGSREQRIGLLDSGADDYLIKPFDLGELVARIRAVVRRNQGEARSPSEPLPDGRIAKGPLLLYPASNSVVWRGASVALTVKEFRVLEVLTQRPGRIVTRQQLEAEVYGWNETVASNAIEVHMHHLRHKLAPNLFRTVRGMGYQFVSDADAPVRPAPAGRVDASG